MSVEVYNSDNPTLEGMDVLGGFKIRLYKISSDLLRDPLSSRRVRKSAKEILKGLPDIGNRPDLVFTHVPRVWAAAGLEIEFRTIVTSE